MMMTALVWARNRGAVVADAVRSILANDHPHFELIVVDQSTDDLTQSAISGMREGTPFRIRPDAWRRLTVSFS